MEPTNFDDFIRSNSKNDLPVPSELNWENMNFTLPPAKRRPRMLLLVLFLLIGALGTGSVLWYLHQRDSTQSQSRSKNDSPGIQNQNSKTILKKEDVSIDTAHPIDVAENRVTRNNATNQETPKMQRPASADVVRPRDAGENRVTRNNSRNRDPFKTKRLARAGIEQAKPLSLNQAAKSNDIEYAKAATLRQTEPAQLDSTEKTNQPRLKLLEPYALPKILPVKAIGSTSSENQPAVSHTDADSNTKRATKPIALLVSIGMNKAQMNHNGARLNDAVTPAWGNSFQILLEYELKNNWLLSIGLGYQRLHTTFNFEKDLGRFVNSSRLEVIRKTRYVFHNNYVDLVSLNLGGGKQFKLSPRWHGQFLMYLSPTRRLGYTGKFLDNSDSVVTFDPNAVVQKKWLLNADAAFRFSYSLKKTDLIIGVNFSQSLTKSNLQSAGSSTTIVQPRVLGFNVGIRRTFGKRKK